MRTFDVVFSNPPYNRGMDHKILKEVIKFSNKIIIVMTQRILVRYSRQKERDALGKYLEKVCLIKNSWELFNIIHYSAEVVYVFNKNKTEPRININDQYFIDTMDDYNRLGKLTEEESEFIKKMRKIKRVENNIFENSSVRYPPKSFKVAYYITGGCNNYYNGLSELMTDDKVKSHTVFPDTKLKEPKEHEGRYFLSFENKEEVDNFRYSYKTIVFKWYLGNFKFEHTISPTLLKRLPFVKGRLENEDWKKILKIPDSLYKKIMQRYKQDQGKTRQEILK